jgi:hypothetical protein
LTFWVGRTLTAGTLDSDEMPLELEVITSILKEVGMSSYFDDRGSDRKCDSDLGLRFFILSLKSIIIDSIARAQQQGESNQPVQYSNFFKYMSDE